MAFTTSDYIIGREVIKGLINENKLQLSGNKDLGLWVELFQKRVIDVNSDGWTYSLLVDTKISKWMEVNESILIELVNFSDIYLHFGDLWMVAETFEMIRSMVLDGVNSIIYEQGPTPEAFGILTKYNEEYADKKIKKVINIFLEFKKRVKWRMYN